MSDRPGFATNVIESEALAEKVVAARLENGLRVYVMPKPGYQKKYATFSTEFGSVDNTFIPAGNEDVRPVTAPDGVAHFLEHKMFEEEYGNVFDRFAELGVSSNAFTNFTATSYLFSGTENFGQSLELLLDFVQRPYFTDANVEKEKGIIAQEIRMYEDSARWRVYFNLLNALYQRHPIRIDIAGTVESITRITKETLYLCHSAFYHPSNMALFVVGDVPPNAVLDQVAANQARKTFPRQGPPTRLYPDEPGGIARPRVEQELAVAQPLLNLGYKASVPRGEGRDLLRRELAVEVALDLALGPSSSLYDDLYRDELIDERFGAEFVLESNYSHLIIGGDTKDPDALQERLLDGLTMAARRGIDRDGFERLRRKLAGQALARFNSLEFIAHNFLAYLFRGIDLFDYLPVLDELKPEDAETTLRELTREDRHAVSIIRPRSEKA